MDVRLPHIGHIDRWHLGIPAGGLGPRDGGIAFSAAELADGPRTELNTAPRIGLHVAMTAELPAAPAVRVRLPGYRGKSLIPVLSWLVTHRLARPGAEVCWYLESQQGPRSIAALLTGLGWQDVQRSRSREDGLVRLSGSPPPHPSPSRPGDPGPDLPRPALPPARQFSAVLGAHELTFLADYGVFSPDRIDDGSRLLAEVMLRQAPVGAVADIGVGYGALAIAAVRNQVAERAVATDVDCLALWLAGRNAAASGVALEVRCTPDPLQAEATPLTVCNVPTHINAAQTAELMRALARRTERGRKLLIVVHASLEARYAGHLEAAGLTALRHPGPSHVVLEAAGRP
jgi:Methyltransferase small domain